MADTVTAVTELVHTVNRMDPVGRMELVEWVRKLSDNNPIDNTHDGPAPRRKQNAVPKLKTKARMNLRNSYKVREMMHRGVNTGEIPYIRGKRLITGTAHSGFRGVSQ